MKKSIILIFCLLLGVLLVSCSEPKTPEEAYADVISEYTELLQKKQSGEEIAESSKNEIKNAIITAVCDCEDPALMGYATKDINGDGAEELFLVSKDYDMYALFTVRDSSPVLLKTFDDGGGAIDPEGTVYSWTLNDAKNDHYDRYRLTENGLEGFELWHTKNADGEQVFFCSLYGNEKEISRSEYQYHIDNYNKYGSTPIKDQTRGAGLRVHLPLAEETESSAPVADISSYDGILELYKTAVSCMEDYSREDWVAGKYDEKLKFNDDESYELYNRLIESCRMHRRRFTYSSTEYMPNGDNAYGYVLRDIGGDSAEELILLTDTYGIIAVFTLNEGAPALIFDSHYGAVNIGSGGEILVNIYYGAYHMEYRSYKMNSANEMELIDLAGNDYIQAENRECFYTLKNGRIDAAAEEEYKAVAERIMACESEVEYYDRIYFENDFTPLFEREKPDTSYENKEFSYNGSAYSDNLIEFSNITEDSFDFKFKYLKIYLADPNDTAFTEYEAVIEATATLDVNGYGFETETVRGRMEFGVGIIWVDIIESKDENIECRPIFLKLIEK